MACLSTGLVVGEKRPPLIRFGWATVSTLLHPPEHVVEVEAGGLLALRILPECGEELPDVGLRRPARLRTPLCGRTTGLELERADRSLSRRETEVRFAADSPVEGGVRCELVSAAGPTPPP